MDSKNLVLFNRLYEAIRDEEEKQPVAQPIASATLFDQLDLALNDEASSEEAFESLLFDLIRHTPKTSSKHFFNQLFGGRKAEALLGDLLAVLLNSSMYTYKVAGPMVGVEKAVLRKVTEMIDYPESSDGTFASGGSMTNFIAMIMGRDAKLAEVPAEGVTQKMTLYTSAESHYSIEKNAAFMGVGRDQVRKIRTDEKGRMDPTDLDKKIQEDLAKSYVPFFVNATAGTTVLGAFDPVDKIASVCKKHNLWLHVDGAYCGGVIFSEKYKHLIQGLEKSNSFSFNGHKMLNTTLTCSIIVTRDKQQLYDSFANEADYLYQTDADEFNLGKTSLQCGRRNDALKIWTLWKAIGTQGIEKMINNQFYLADVARAYVSSHDDYELLSFDNSISVCFNYKNKDAREVCQTLYDQAALMVSHGSFEGQDFIRFVTINSTNSKEDILNFFEVLEKTIG